MSEDTEEYATPEITDKAHASASVGLTLILGNRTAWPKFEFGDNALPGETSEELIARVNTLTLDGAFSIAEQTRHLMLNELNPNKDK